MIFGIQEQFAHYIPESNVVGIEFLGEVLKNIRELIMSAYILLSITCNEWLALYFDSHEKGIFPVEVNAARASALVAAFLAAHGNDQVEIKRIPLGYDGSPEGLLYDLEFTRSESFEELKRECSDAWYMKLLMEK